MKIAELRKAGDIMRRKGLAERALEIAQEMVKDGSYERAIEGAGQLEVLAKACTFDCYWDEKRWIGKNREESKMQYVIERGRSIDGESL